MPKRRVMIIGAGQFQLKGIEKALELGLEVVATDGNPGAPGLKAATHSEILDVKDVDGHIRLAKLIKPAAVLSIATDIALRTVMAVCKNNDLRTTSDSAIEISLNKRLQRELFSRHGLPQPRFAIASNYSEALDCLRVIGFPLVVKPVDNSGSRGVYVLEDDTNLKERIKEALSFSAVKEIIIEEFINGTECTVEGITIDKKHHILAISDKYKPESKFRVATELCYPARLPVAITEKIKRIMEKTYAAMDIDYAPTHSEVIVSEKDPYIIEVSCRGGGFYVFTDVVEAVSGVDIISLWIKTCMGQLPFVGKPLKKGAVLRFFAPPSGKLSAIKGEDKIKDMDGIRYGFFIKPGELIPELRSDGNRTGFMLARGANSRDALSKADFVSKSIQFDIEAIQ